MLKGLLDIGVRNHYESHENLIARKLNFNSLVGIFNVLVCVVFFLVIGDRSFLPILLFAFVGLVLTIVANWLKGYIWAGYVFFLWGFIFLIDISLLMGKDTFIFLFFFPTMVALVQVFGRREYYIHLLILGFFLVISVVFVAFGFYYLGFLERAIDETVRNVLMVLNIVLSVSTMTAITFMTVSDQIKHEAKLRKANEEKEVLLAEVYHRVKNNMNIVTSLLNLRKNNSSDPDVIDALEECRSRIFSMSLVHETIYRSDKSVGLKLNEYIKRLTESVAHGLAITGKYTIEFDLDEVELDLDSSIPCGMIVNEVLTNAFKHSVMNDRILQIIVSMKKEDNQFILNIRDNGPGAELQKLRNNGSLGVDLVSSLAEQMNAEVEFSNSNGLVFTMTVRLAS